MFSFSEVEGTADTDMLFSRVLHIYTDKSSRRNLKICDSDKRTPIYFVRMKHIRRFSGRTRITMSRASTRPPPAMAGAPVATASLHKIGPSIDLHFGSSTVPLLSTGPADSLKFDSLLGPLTWHRDGWVVFQLKLVDANENLVARFRHEYGSSMRRWGKIEIADGVERDRCQRLLDEIVMSAVAMVQKQRNTRRKRGHVYDDGPSPPSSSMAGAAAVMSAGAAGA